MSVTEIIVGKKSRLNMAVSIAEIKKATETSQALKVADLNDLFWMIVGEKQVGKSTFCSRFESPFFIDLEERLDSITMPDGTRPPQVIVRDWDTLVSWTDGFLGTTPEETGVKTIIVDGVGVGYKYLALKVLKTSKQGAKNLNDLDLGYAKGWMAARDEYVKWFMSLRALKQQGYGIVLTTHDRIVPFTNNNVEMDKKVPLIADDKDEKYGWGAVRAFPDFVVYAHKAMTPEGIVHMAQIRGNPMIEAGCPTPPKGHQLPDQLPFVFQSFRDAWEGTE